MTNATVYFDIDSDANNPGWACETDEHGHPQYYIDIIDETASDEVLRAEAASYADGDITIDRSNIPKGYVHPRSNQPIIDAIEKGLKAGGDETDWFAPEFEEARDLTEAADCQWDFDGWKDALRCIKYGRLAGVRFRGAWPFTGLSGYEGL